MKKTIGEIVGKHISGVVVSRNPQEPRMQLFLQFSDQTFLEIWGESFNCAGLISRGGRDEILTYTSRLGASVVSVFPGEDAPGSGAAP